MPAAIAKAEELVAATPGSWMPQQFENPANEGASRDDRRGNSGTIPTGKWTR
jgi:cysteine synthase